MILHITPRRSWPLSERKRAYTLNRTKRTRTQVCYGNRRYLRALSDLREDFWYLTHSYLGRK